MPGLSKDEITNPLVFSDRLYLTEPMLEDLRDALKGVGFLRDDAARLVEYIRANGVKARLHYAEVLSLAFELADRARP